MFDYLNKLSSLKERRLVQIEREERLDSLLKKSYYLCPKYTLEYIWISREKNREEAIKVYNSSFFSSFEKIDNVLEKVETIHNKYNINCPIELCEKLPEIIGDIKNI